MSRHIMNGMSSETLPPEKLDIIRQLDDVFEGNKLLISAYLKRFGFSQVVAPNIRIIRREFDAGSIVSEEIHFDLFEQSGTQNADGARSPFYLIEVHCLYCKTGFQASMLRSKSLTMAYHYKNPLFPLMVAEAVETTKGYALEDPLVRSITVCPTCLYTATSIGYFASDSAMSETKSVIGRLGERKFQKAKEAIDADQSVRRSLVRDESAKSSPADPSKFFGAARTTEQAIVAYQLAAHCFALLSDFDPASSFHASEALLAAAKLSSNLELPQQEEEFLRGAIVHLEKYFEISRSSSALALYLLCVISWHLGDEVAAKTWAGRILSHRNKFTDFPKFKRYIEDLKNEMREE